MPGIMARPGSGVTSLNSDTGPMRVILTLQIRPAARRLGSEISGAGERSLITFSKFSRSSGAQQSERPSLFYSKVMREASTASSGPLAR